MSGSGGESISSTQSMVLDLPPSCIEFCPAYPDLFVIGTYNLEKAEEAEPVLNTEEKDKEEEVPQSSTTNKQPQSRNGSIILFQLRQGKVHPIQTISQPSAVFDLHFQPHQGKGDIFATVSSTGTISVFRLVVPSDGINPSDNEALIPDILQPLSTLRIPDLDEGTLFTYFAWHPSILGLVAITTASGQVVLAQLNNNYQTVDVLETSILEHSLEAWVVAFSPPQSPPPPNPPPEPTPPSSSTLFSGGDDSALQYTTYTPSTDPPTPYSPITLRTHTAGVTAILPLPLLGGAHIVLTGSYDDTLRVFAITPLHTTFGAKQAQLLAERNLGGGVWRLNLVGEPAYAGSDNRWAVTVLASCMHAGARVLRVTGGDGGGGGGDNAVGVEVLARFEEHQSMNYGSDWSRVERSSEGDGKRWETFVSTSFYDRLLCVWSMNM